jgi:hypothetical protein
LILPGQSTEEELKYQIGQEAEKPGKSSVKTGGTGTQQMNMTADFG